MCQFILTENYFLFSSTYSYPLSVQLSHFKVQESFLGGLVFLLVFFFFGQGVVLGKREEGGRRLLQFVFSC